MNACRLVLFAWTTMIFAGVASAKSYTFQRVADSAGPFSDFFGAPSINAARTVAFPAYLDIGGHGIFTDSRGQITTIVDTNGPTSAILSSPSINAAGTVAFVARLDSGGEGVFIGNGGPTTTIAESSGQQFNSFFGSVPAINSSGVVAFFAELDDGNGIFTGSGGPITTIADSSGPFNNLRSNPSINTEGTVAFSAYLDDGSRGIFTGSGGATTNVLDGSGRFSSGGVPLINENGTIAFFGRPDSGGEGFFITEDGTITTIVDDGGPFRFFSAQSLNMTASGKVAFAATLDDETPGNLFDNPMGVFTGDDAVADKVIQTGDMLFGSMVTDLLFFRGGLNDHGDVAFHYELANGTEGIAVARPVPEPASPVLLAISGMMLFVRRTKWRYS